MSGSTVAVSETSDLILKDISMGVGADVTKGSHNAVSRSGWSCNTESAVGIAACEDRRALANVFKSTAGASQVAGVVLTLLLDESRKNLIGGNGGLNGNHPGVMGVMGRLNGNHLGGNGGLNEFHLLKLAGNVDGDDRGSRRGNHRESTSGVGGIGEDSIILLEEHGGERSSCSLQEEEGEDDKESEGLVKGADLSASKAESNVVESSVQSLGVDGLAGETTGRRRRNTNRHDHPMVCLGRWMDGFGDWS